jgi:hypothetical protein
MIFSLKITLRHPEDKGSTFPFQGDGARSSESAE